MTTPRWTKKAYVKLILAVLVIVLIIVALVCVIKVFNTSSFSSQSSSNEELSKTSNLKTLVESFLKGELAFFSFDTHTHDSYLLAYEFYIHY